MGNRKTTEAHNILKLEIWFKIPHDVFLKLSLLHISNENFKKMHYIIPSLFYNLISLAPNFQFHSHLDPHPSHSLSPPLLTLLQSYCINLFIPKFPTLPLSNIKKNILGSGNVTANLQIHIFKTIETVTDYSTQKAKHILQDVMLCYVDQTQKSFL